MKKLLLTTLLALVSVNVFSRLPKQSVILEAMHRANDYFMQKNPDPTKPTFVKKERPSNLWTRGVYFEGLIELINIDNQERDIDYLSRWASFHKYTPRNGVTTRDADDYCCCQAYLYLYERNKNLTGKGNPDMLAPTQQCMDNLLSPPESAEDQSGKVRWNKSSVEDWTWIDAIQMGLPVLTRLSRIKYLEGDSNSSRYCEQGWKMYQWTRDVLAGGLFNEIEGLWWRDKDFVPPYKEPNGMNCYWSRGNGWVYAALVRAMDNAMIGKHSAPPSNMEATGEYKWIIQDYENHFEDYRKDFCKMSYALAHCQRKDNFWNVSLHDESNYGGKELSGTSLFIYGMAWGVRHGILPKKMFIPIISRTWKSIYKHCLHDNGFLGYVQGTGKEPKDSQPIGYDTEPDFDDFGLGCFLLASAEVYRLSN